MGFSEEAAAGGRREAQTGGASGKEQFHHDMEC
jgi:hypothetical protein